MTQQVLGACPGATARGISYLGGGSGVGIANQGAATQRISPGSRALKNTEYCPTGTVGTAPKASALNAESLLLGVDGISVVVNTASSCSTGTTVNSLGKSSFSVPTLADYVPADSFDVLKLLYFGMLNGSGGTAANTYDCNSPQRKALVASWTNLFGTDCSTGDSICPNGLVHAYRRDDISGTADALVGVLNPPGRALGTLSNAANGKSRKINPYCNSHDANNGTTSYTDEGNVPSAAIGATYWEAADMTDEDPIRITANPNTLASTTGDSVARGQVSTFKGSLGLVLPIFPPDAAGIGAADAYPTVACSGFCDTVPIKQTSGVPSGFTCPDGSPVGLNTCFLPIISQANPDPRCISSNTNKCFGAVGSPDGRAYNLATVVLQTQLPTANQATGYTYGFALDQNKRIMNGSFYRIHMQKRSPNSSPDTSVGQTGICKETDATSQIGCLVDADRCSTGFAGREAAKNYPGLVDSTGAISGTPAPGKALAISGAGVAATPPFTPDAVAIAATGGASSGAADPDLALKNLLETLGSLPFYPLARRLFLHTIFGFGDAGQLATGTDNADNKSGERELVKCFNDPTITTAAMSKHGFVSHVTSGGAIECQDYPENSTSTAQPPVNIQGPGNVAFPGCGFQADGVTPLFALNHNACTDSVTAP